VVPTAKAAFLFILIMTFGSAGLLSTGCQRTGEENTGPAQLQSSQPLSPAKTTMVLADTKWSLVEFQSMDDAIGTKRTIDPSRYTMQLGSDGQVEMRLNCNAAAGTWSAEPGQDRLSGRFEFGRLTVTSALCPPPSLDELVSSQAPYVRSYLLQDGRLYLSLMADGGIFVWQPQTDKPRN